jgi:hypothetical protein
LAPEPDSRLQRVRRLAHWLDDGIRIPGTRFRIGADPIFGLVPVVGDLIGAFLGAILVVQGARLGVPLPTLLRLIWNLVVDALLGAVPILGDLYDAVAKVNLRNLALLERSLAEPHLARRADRAYLLGITLILGLTLIGLLAGSFLLVRWLVGWLVH